MKIRLDETVTAHGIMESLRPYGFTDAMLADGVWRDLLDIAADLNKGSFHDPHCHLTE